MDFKTTDLNMLKHLFCNPAYGEKILFTKNSRENRKQYPSSCLFNFWSKGIYYNDFLEFGKNNRNFYNVVFWSRDRFSLVLSQARIFKEHLQWNMIHRELSTAGRVQWIANQQ